MSAPGPAAAAQRAEPRAVAGSGTKGGRVQRLPAVRLPHGPGHQNAARGRPSLAGWDAACSNVPVPGNRPGVHALVAQPLPPLPNRNSCRCHRPARGKCVVPLALARGPCVIKANPGPRTGDAMTDEPVHTPPVAEPAPARARIEPSPPQRRIDALPILYVLGFLVLSGALFYLYRHPPMPDNLAQDSARVQTLQDQVRSLTERLGRAESRTASAPVNVAPLEARIAELERRPAGPAGAPDLAPMQARIADLEKRPTTGPGAPGVDLSPLAARIAELEKRPAPGPGAPAVDLAPLTARIADLEKRPVPAPVDLGPLTSKLDALESRPPVDLGPLTQRLAALETQLRTASADTAKRIDGIDAKLAATEAQAKQTAAALTGISDRAQRVARLQAATAALYAGQKLGEIAGAPPALSRFATDAPPTEAALRLSFNQAAEAAQRASQPAIMEDKPFATRLWNRAQQVVTVRQGDRVLLGDPIAGVLAHAREALEAGDLRGAVQALDGLAGPAAAAMAPWKGQAAALLDARAALAGLAAS